MPRPLAALQYVIDIYVEKTPNGFEFRYTGDIVRQGDRHLIEISGYLSFVVLLLRTPGVVFASAPVQWKLSDVALSVPANVRVNRDSPVQASILVTGLFPPVSRPAHRFAPVVEVEGVIAVGPDPTIIEVEPP